MSLNLVYILLGVALVIFIVITIRDWANQRKREKEPAAVEGGGEARQAALPLCLQAYERPVVLMERIKPESLAGRVGEPGINAADLRRLMIHSIRAEYDHNISQQIYVSREAWQAVSNAKEQLVSLINSVSEKIPPEAEGRVLTKQLLELSLKEKDFPLRTALAVLNAEAKKLMGYKGK
jgi:hypothetical protein